MVDYLVTYTGFNFYTDFYPKSSLLFIDYLKCFTKLSSETCSLLLTLWDWSDFIQSINGFGMSIQGTQIKESINKLYCKCYCEVWSQRGFPSVEPIWRGKAIIWPIIEGATDVDLSIPQAIVHLYIIRMHI